MESVLRTINREAKDFQTKHITIVPGFTFNQWETLQKIIFYYNSKFQTGEVDEEGDRKYFNNITKNPCKVWSKAVDFDTKNIRLLTAGGGDPLKTWFMERDLKFWMRDKKFGKTLNRLFRELPIFGTVVLKVIDNTPYFVDLRNLIVEQAADSLDDANYIIEVHNYTPDGFRKEGRRMGWPKAKVNEVIDKFYEMQKTSHIRVFERYGEIKGDNDEYSYKRVFIADVGKDEFDERTGELLVERPGVELGSDEYEGHPYWEFHAEKMPGRWLGIGVVESLFEPQIRQNEIANQEAKMGSYLSLLLFQTRDSGFNRNLRTEARNGEVLVTDSEITPINISDRNGAFFNEQTRKWLMNRDEIAFSYDAVQGERSPAGTPLGSVQIAVSQTMSYFEQLQEDIAMEVKELLYKEILPGFEKESSKEHALRLVGQDLDVYIDMIKNDLANKQVIKLAIQSLNGKPFPTNDDREAILLGVSEAVKQGKEKILTIPKGFYNNVKYDVDIDITGESVDTRVRSATMFAILQAITSDPMMTQDPIKKKMLYRIAEDGGINMAEFMGNESQENQMMQMAGNMKGSGGGVSAPMGGGALMGEAQKTV